MGVPMSDLRRVLLFEKTIGKGVVGDPVRIQLCFYDEKTLNLICRVDPFNETATFGVEASRG